MLQTRLLLGDSMLRYVSSLALSFLLSGFVWGCSQSSDEAEARTRDSLEAVASKAQAEAAEARLQAERIRAEEEARRNDPSYQRQVLLESEQKDWRQYVTATDTEWKNPFFGAAYAKAVIINTATLASFKDVEFEVRFLSKTGAILGRSKRVLYEFLAPGSQVPVKIEDLKVPSAAADFKIVVTKVSRYDDPGC